MNTFFSILVGTYLLCSFKAQAQDVVGCGGFVESSIPINYERVEVRVFMISFMASTQSHLKKFLKINDHPTCSLHVLMFHVSCIQFFFSSKG